MTHSNFVCGASGTYKPNSTYQKNLNDTLSALTKANNGSGFLTASSDTAQEDQINTAYALALCPGDFDNEGCTGCVNYATNQLIKDCPNQKKATGWYNGICMLSYSNSTFNMVDDDDNYVIAIWTKIIPDRDSVLQTELRKLFNQLVGAAATDGYDKAFYSDKTTLQDTAYIEGSMQCIPNISQNIFSKCLTDATNYLLTNCNGREQVVVYFRNSCFLRYFISVIKRTTVIPIPIAPSMPPTTPQMILPPGKKTSNVIGPAVAAAAVTLTISTILICLKGRARARAAWMLWEECKGDQLIDENVNDDCPVDQALKLRIALLCIEEDANDRPTMSSVVFMLEGEWKFLSDPKPPMSFGQFIDSDQSSLTWNGDKS
ncbi:hypothetical protein L1887_17277 [Cichorium endivia]|nr:hypothetical protein L1887_17277 [Cichorium endivia]